MYQLSVELGEGRYTSLSDSISTLTDTKLQEKWGICAIESFYSFLRHNPLIRYQSMEHF